VYLVEGAIAFPPYAILIVDIKKYDNNYLRI